MTTNFLPVGIINEQIEELAELAARLKAQTSADQQVVEIAARIYEIIGDLHTFINGFSSQPFIFTGAGSTEEIISRLEWLFIFADEQSEANPRGIGLNSR